MTVGRRTSDLERPYGGRPATERRAERRERLLDAGLELYGTRGFSNTTIKQICQTAGLNERYFYESFVSREELLGAVYDMVLDDLVRQVLDAVAAAPPDPVCRARSGLQAFAQALAGDRRRARVQLLEVVGVNDELAAKRRARLHQFAEVIDDSAAESIDLAHADGQRRRLMAMGLVGATNELMIDWFLDTPGADLDAIVDAATNLFQAAALQLASPPPT